MLGIEIEPQPVFVIRALRSGGGSVATFSEPALYRVEAGVRDGALALAGHFGKRTKTRIQEITQILQSLRALG